MSDQSAAPTSAVEQTTSKSKAQPRASSDSSPTSARAQRSAPTEEKSAAPDKSTNARTQRSPRVRQSSSTSNAADPPSTSRGVRSEATGDTSTGGASDGAPFRSVTTPPPPPPSARNSAASSSAGSASSTANAGVGADAAGSAGGTDAPKRRRRRGGRGRGGRSNATTQPGSDASGGDSSERGDQAESGAANRSGTKAKSGSDKNRSADRPNKSSTGSKSDQNAAIPAGTDGGADAENKGAKRNRNRRSGGKSGGSSATAESKRSSDQRGTKGNRRNADSSGGDKKRRRNRSDKGPASEPRREVHTRNGKAAGRYSMCIHIREEGTQVAILEGRALVEHALSRPDPNRNIHGNIYLGRVRNVLPGMEAAFVDIGTDKNAVLYRRDVPFDSAEFEGQAPPIEGLLRNGQQVLVQVTKNPIDAKGARLTGAVSQAGRFVVLLPGQPETFGLSKRLPQQERRRLRKVLERIKPEDAGLIIRTAAEGASAEELRLDVEMLARQWAQIQKDEAQFKAPRLLYQEPDLPLRVVREELSSDFRAVYIDHEPTFNAVRNYVEQVLPELVDRVHFYNDDLALFERYHVEEQLMKALDRKVWLPSGGSLIFESTEALTVIDVNTSKNVGSSNLEETVFRNNLEAAEEIGRQLRLRDIGGIIVIDFIDMEIEANRKEVFRHFQEILSRDKTRTYATPISDLGLVEMTRKRVAGDLVDAFSHTCEHCSGRGITYDQSLL